MSKVGGVSGISGISGISGGSPPMQLQGQQYQKSPIKVPHSVHGTYSPLSDTVEWVATDTVTPGDVVHIDTPFGVKTWTSNKYIAVGDTVRMSAHGLNTACPGSPDQYWYLKAVHMRLHVQEGDRLPFDYMAAYRYNTDMVVVLICDKDQYVVLEDRWEMFPSDALITRMNMLRMANR